MLNNHINLHLSKQCFIMMIKWLVKYGVRQMNIEHECVILCFFPIEICGLYCSSHYIQSDSQWLDGFTFKQSDASGHFHGQRFAQSWQSQQHTSSKDLIFISNCQYYSSVILWLLSYTLSYQSTFILFKIDQLSAIKVNPSISAHTKCPNEFNLPRRILSTTLTLPNLCLSSSLLFVFYSVAW